MRWSTTASGVVEPHGRYIGCACAFDHEAGSPGDSTSEGLSHESWLTPRIDKRISRPIAALLLLQSALDANYRAVKDSTYPWPAKAITS
jgi:hypothetical protein